MKKEELNYYDEFLRLSKIAEDIAVELKAFAASYNHELTLEKSKKIHEMEHRADNIVHSTLSYLIKDFVPPIDREDFLSVVRRMDDVIDCIDEVSIDLDIFCVKQLRANIAEYVNLIEKGTSKLNTLFEKFNGMKNYEEVKSLGIEIGDIEEEGDLLYQNSIKQLYSEENDTKEVVKWTKIYSKLEDCFDSLQHIAECVDEIYMKNS